ncbi:MAG: peptidylprolyl isomerase [Gemmatimonadota bacterium]
MTGRGIRGLALTACLTGFSLAGCATGDDMTHPTVTLETSLGDIRIEMLIEEAPVSTANFLSYVDAGFYEGLVFHRVIPGFMVQSGGLEADLAERAATGNPIINESDNGLGNLRGTLAMARMQAPHSASSQFFINVVDNPRLDYGALPGGWGYAVFGRVIEGMDVVDEIASRPTGSLGMYQDVPLEPIVIRKARRAADVRAVAEESAD